MHSRLTSYTAVSLSRYFIYHRRLHVTQVVRFRPLDAESVYPPKPLIQLEAAILPCFGLWEVVKGLSCFFCSPTEASCP